MTTAIPSEVRENIRTRLIESSFATTLHAIALLVVEEEELYSVDTPFLEIFAQIQEAFNVEIEDTNRQKLQAILTSLTTDGFYNDPDVFVAVCNTLIHGDPMFNMEEDLEVIEILWGIYEVSLNLDNPDEMEFSEQIEEIIDNEINNEKEDMEALTLEDVAQESYFKRFLVDQKLKLFSELKTIREDLTFEQLPDIEF